jgi:enoyl-CoA hydratase/carnithine racemase
MTTVLSTTPSKHLFPHDLAHRDTGGKVTIAIFRCRKITICAVNGHAAGVGITGLQLPCDFRFVWSGAKLAFPFVRRGIAAEGALRYHSSPASPLRV